MAAGKLLFPDSKSPEANDNEDDAEEQETNAQEKDEECDDAITAGEISFDEGSLYSTCHPAAHQSGISSRREKRAEEEEARRQKNRHR